MQLDRPPRTEAEPGIVKSYVGAGRGWFGGDSVLVVVVQIDDSVRSYDLFELAHMCLSQWRDFLARE
jgi:hypothetical protein